MLLFASAPGRLFSSPKRSLSSSSSVTSVSARHAPRMTAEHSQARQTQTPPLHAPVGASPDSSPPLLAPPSCPRPPTVNNFSISFEDLVIRPFHPRDSVGVAAVISAALEEHGLPWDPENADKDAVTIPTAYAAGEFWVVEDPATVDIVATAAFRPFPERGPNAVEIRKMYLRPAVRRRGLGSFLLTALEHRAHQLGYTVALVETASELPAACAMYQSFGYTNSPTPIVTKRCDTILEKPLGRIPLFTDGLEVVDSTRGWTVAFVAREDVMVHRLVFRAAVVLVQTDDHIVVHRRALSKKTYPGRMAVLVTGCVDWGEAPLEAARREVEEEVGLQNLKFSEPFEPWISVGSDDHRQRILFHPFVATGEFQAKDIVCEPSEVDCALLMTRAEIQKEGIGGSLWAEYRKHAL